MIINSSGIVLSTLRYSDSSVIARIYTNQIGLGSFMVRTGKGKSALSKLSLLQPLSLVEISFDNDERKSLKSVRSIERESTLNAIPFDTVKTCIALFLAEVIFRSINEEEENSSLFGFLRASVLLLDQSDSCANFHLKFMLEFSKFLGFYPQEMGENKSYFDLVEGEFTAFEPIHPHALSDTPAQVFGQLLSVEMEAHATVRVSSSDRRVLLQKLIDYYRLHLDGMREITSHKVLEEVMV